MINELISKISLDMILSDKLLLVGTIFLIIGPILFLIALIQYIRAGQREDAFTFASSNFGQDENIFIPPPAVESPPPQMPPSQTVEKVMAVAPPTPLREPTPSTEVPPPPPPAIETSKSPPKWERPTSRDHDQTIVMPPGMAEMQAQFEISVSQIKNLNRRVSEMEQLLTSLKKQIEAQANSKENAEQHAIPPSKPPVMPI